MTTRRQEAKPGYLEYRPPSYQVLGPEQDDQLDRILVTYPDSQGTNVAADERAVRFWVRTPQVRCRTRVVVFAKADQPALGNPQPVDPDVDTIGIMYEIGGSPPECTLWVVEHERGNGDGVKAAPVRNVVGTGAAPLPIPTDTRLWGYAFEIETNGTELYGVFVAPNNVIEGAAAPSKWHVAVRYESVIPVGTEEWNQFLGRQLLRVQPPQGIVIANP